MTRQQELIRAAGEGRLPHAVIVTGEGATALCERAGAALLCIAPAGQRPCGVCENCRMIAVISHPDVLHLVPEPGKKSIGVEGVRSLIAALSSAPARGGKRAVLIPDAERLTEKAQNALLKTLEEPPVGTAFFLSGNENGLLPTVRSRCLTFRLPQPEIDKDPAADELANKLVSSLLAKNLLDRSLFPTDRGELDDLFERLAHACAARFAATQNGRLNQAVDILVEARGRLAGNANAKMLIDWVRVKLERAFR